MKDVKKILLATDFSSGSTAALKQGARLIERDGTQLDLLHVVDTHDLSDLAEALHQSPQETEKQFKENATHLVDQWLNEAGYSDKFSPTIVSGQPLDCILNRIKENKIDLLLVGLTGQEHESSREAVGVLASKLIRTSPVRVLAVHSHQNKDFKHVVACVDFSKTSQEAIRQAIHVAELEKSHLSIIHVYNPPWDRLRYKAPTSGSDVAFQKRFETALMHKLKDYAPIPDAIQHDYQLCPAANIGYGIAEFARKSGSDLIVLGTKGKSNLRYMFTGSTAERVLRELPCSALVVKPAS
ncbi:MAG: universal stress protein [Verrucomicrobia bacterium]|jgi:universal stress protein E|nr:universal stress protein [Verrucomicrobiota bacterium]